MLVAEFRMQVGKMQDLKMVSVGYTGYFFRFSCLYFARNWLLADLSIYKLILFFLTDEL